MSAPIEDYALIGDGRTTALVHRSGSIDWLCLPRFDSDACLAALVGTDDHGCWTIAPAGDDASSRRRYVGDTMILETEHATTGGRVRVVDFMPVHDGPPAIVRRVTGLEGSVAMRHRLALRFDHGRVAPWIAIVDGGYTAMVGPDRVAVRMPFAVSEAEATDGVAFDVAAGQTLTFVLVHGDACSPPPTPLDVDRLLDETTARWHRWIGRFTKPSRWPAATRRSLLTLHALIDRRTGGMVAAPTTSLPEVRGGSDNWDYRFCWLRDATFTLGALLNAGFHDEAVAWRDWLLRALGGDPGRLRIAYRVDGTADLAERNLGWLPGYDGAKPVRAGNAAWEQRQIDVFGELIDALALAGRAGLDHDPHADCVVAQLAWHLERVWDEPGQGLWESRGEPRQYVYSKVMAWVGIDRVVHGAGGDAIDAATRRRLAGLRDDIHAQVCEKGYHRDRGVFVQHYDSDSLDASLLLLPLVGFLPADDPRMARTIDAIERELMVDGFVMREPSGTGRSEGAFLPCTCWFADCRAMQGRRDEACAALERVLSVANDVGLLSEEYDASRRRLMGNFPQALTHLAVVNTTLGLSGPVLQRGGG